MRARDAGFLVIVVAIFLACVLRDPRADDHPFRSFHPLPDAIEYAVGAISINAGHGVMLPLNGREMPSRYPFGFPLIIALFYRILGSDIVNAYYVSILFGAASIPLMFAFARAVVDDRSVARWSAFFLATSSLMLVYSTLVMAEACSVFLVLLALNIAARLRSEGGLIGWALLGAVLGFALTVRPVNVIVIPPIAAYLWFAVERPRVRHGAALLAPIAAALCVILAYNAAVFGSPFRDGYALHVPEKLFGWQYVAANAWQYARALVLAQGGKTIWFDGPFYGPIVPALAIVGLLALRRAGRRELVVLVTAWFIVFFAFYAGYAFHDLRFFLTALPLLSLLAGSGVCIVLRRWGGVRRAAVAAVVLVLSVAQPFSGGLSSLAAARYNRTMHSPPASWLYVQSVNAYMDRVGARPDTHFVLSALNLVYHDHYSNKRYTLMPLTREQDYAWVDELKPIVGVPEIDALVAQGREVFLSDFAVQVEKAQAAIAAFGTRYRLEPVSPDVPSLVRVLPKTGESLPSADPAP